MSDRNMNMLTIETVSIANIKPFERNAKKHPQEQVDQIKRSIIEFGMNDPIAIDENNTVIERHGRLLALKQLDYTEAPCIRLSHLNAEQKRAYILTHNKLTLNSGFDLDMLAGELDYNIKPHAMRGRAEVAVAMPMIQKSSSDKMIKVSQAKSNQRRMS